MIGGKVTTRLADLKGDVNITSLADTQILRYDNASGKWLNVNLTTTLAGLTDVTLTSVANNNILRYNSGSSKWVNVDSASDFLTQYLLLAGRSGGQIGYGGTAAGETLSLRSTAHATKGKTDIGQVLYVDEVNSRVGINQTSPSYALDLKSTAGSVATITSSNSGSTTIRIANTNSSLVWDINQFMFGGQMLTISEEFSGVTKIAITNGGKIVLGNGTSPTAMVSVLVNADNAVGFDIKRNSSTSTANLLNLLNQSGTVLSAFDVAGKLGVLNGTPANPVSINSPTTSDTLAQLLVATGSTTNKGIVIQAVASQSANIIEVQKSDGTNYWAINATGSVFVGNFSGYTDTTRTLNIYNASADANIKLAAGASNAASLMFGTGSNTLTQIYRPSSVNDLYFYTGGSGNSAILKYTNGFWGFNDTNPANRLTVKQTDAAQGLFYGYDDISNSATNGSGEILLGNAATVQGRLIYNWNTGGLSLESSWDNDGAFVQIATRSANVRAVIAKFKTVGGVPACHFAAGTPVVAPSLGAAATDLASVITLANNIRTCLINNGLATA